MNELELMAKRSFYLLLGSASLSLKEANRFLENFGENTQALVNDMVREGEVTWSEWTQTQPSTVDPQLRQRLFELVRGDWNLAERLLQQARVSSPGHSEDWYYDKVIYDLERDHQR